MIRYWWSRITWGAAAWKIQLSRFYSGSMLFCSEEITDQVWPSGLTVQPTIYLVEQKFMAIHFNTDVTDKLRCSYSPEAAAAQKHPPPCTTTKSWEDTSCQPWALAPCIISRLMHQLMQHSAGRNYNIMHTNILVLLTSHCGKSWRCRASIQASWTSSSPARPVQPTSCSTSRSATTLEQQQIIFSTVLQMVRTGSLSLSLSFLLQQNWSRRSRESASVAGVYCGDEEEDPLGRERKRAAWVGNGQVEKGRWRKGEGRGWTVEVRNQWFFKQDFVM